MQPTQVSKPFRSGYHDDTDLYYVAELDHKIASKYYNKVIEPYNNKTRHNHIDFWYCICEPGSMDTSEFDCAEIAKVGLFYLIEDELNLTKETNRALVIGNLASDEGVDPITFINTYCAEVETQNYVTKLTALQHQIGYVKGRIQPVALLGLLGEVGEVAAEAEIYADNTQIGEIDDLLTFEQVIAHYKALFVEFASEIDRIKKKVRSDSRYSQALRFEVTETKFNVELADVFYYLNATASCLGMSLEDLAKLSYQKVIARRATIGPELLDKPETSA
ncbi:hypothetical protein EQG79_00660 [Spirosoma sordidisoli]|uniref:NTP pyrophosphohydrolase MazG putative catalytic core domain-containing protein n=2 Tax=Spirosoma sordidisoli TaxID=2502893 RepID=A0A4Q2UN07_9BACT|nr:hypothetical protein EQG79_00660 [Spirosoma sordidisoli]